MYLSILSRGFLSLSARAAYIREQRLIENVLKGIDWGALALVIPSLLNIFGGLFVSAKE
jgi:hypothetical protein